MIVALRVEMTGMPQLVAASPSSLVCRSLARGNFIGINSEFVLDPHRNFATNAHRIIHEVEVFLGVFIGAITFTGSIVAYGKLAGKL